LEVKVESFSSGSTKKRKSIISSLEWMLDDKNIIYSYEVNE